MEQAADSSPRTAGRTAVEIRCTGHLRAAVGTGKMEFSFAGDTLRDLLEAFFAEYDVRDMILAETEADATATGWAPAPDELPGTWRKNPEGEQTREFVRVTVNGVFNEHLAGLDTEIEAGDRVALMYPFVFCV